MRLVDLVDGPLRVAADVEVHDRRVTVGRDLAALPARRALDVGDDVECGDAPDDVLTAA
jgi:hypothetical protein